MNSYESAEGTNLREDGGQGATQSRNVTVLLANNSQRVHPGIILPTHKMTVASVMGEIVWFMVKTNKSKLI